MIISWMNHWDLKIIIEIIVNMYLLRYSHRTIDQCNVQLNNNLICLKVYSHQWKEM